MIKCDGHRIQVSISGSETIEFTYAFEHYTVQNLGLSAIYVSIKDPNCTSNAPDVTYIKAGGEANIDGDGVSMRVHFRGSGSIQIVGKHDRLLDFKSALTEGGGGGEGKVYEGVLPIVVNNDENKISVNPATSSTVGVVKPDNTTITINNGVLSAVGGGIISAGGAGVKCVHVTITPDMWTESENIYFPYEAIIPVTDMSHTDRAIFIPAEGDPITSDNAILAQNAGINMQQTTLDGGHLVRAKVLPTEDIEGDLIIFDGLGTLRTLIGEQILINPDFKINQRGRTGTITHSATASENYFVDRWYLKSGSVTVNDDGSLTLNGTMIQILESPAGENVTASASAGTSSYDDSTKTFSITGSNVHLTWAKLERGSEPTSFLPPDPSVELVKCMRYFERQLYPLNAVTRIITSHLTLTTANVGFEYEKKASSSPNISINPLGPYIRIIANNCLRPRYPTSITMLFVSDTSCTVWMTLDDAPEGSGDILHGWVDSLYIDIDAELYPTGV